MMVNLPVLISDIKVHGTCLYFVLEDDNRQGDIVPEENPAIEISHSDRESRKYNHGYRRTFYYLGKGFRE